MNKIKVLDCTLRDGGYCNDWTFGFENAKTICEGLINANVDIIECGFLTNKEKYNSNRTKFSTVQEAEKIIPENKDGKLFVVMMNYGEYRVEDLPPKKESNIDGIRIAFHKKNLKEALSLCSKIKEKGYLVFVQPMLSLGYNDEEFLSLIHAANEIEPYAFYIVDSFGMMKGKDLTRLFYMVEHNLKDNIWIGFHSHNNMQLAYSNAQRLTTVQTSRNLIIDSSIMGMGRGAGNLNTELFVDYLNDIYGERYQISPLLSIIDNVITHFYERNYWGYSLPNYISAQHNAHPNYAKYLDAKKTLTFKEMNEIFDMMDEEKRESFDQDYIEEIYLDYQEKNQVHDENLSDLRNYISGKEVLIIAPGQSSVLEKNKIVEFKENHNVIVISVNYDFDESITDYLFVSNIRRFRDLPDDKKKKCIVTSNIGDKDVYLKVQYRDLLNSEESVKDNAGLMLAKLLLKLGIKKLYIAGMDGYSVNNDDNYADNSMSFKNEKEQAEKKNKGITKVLKEIQKDIEVEFVTTPKYIVI